MDYKTSARKFGNHATQFSHRMSGWALLAPGEVVRWAASLDRRTLAWSTLALAAILLLTLNLVSSLLFRNVKADLTADGLYTISDGTRKVMSRLEEPVNVPVTFFPASTVTSTTFVA